jgi:TolA-binding protein
MTARGVLCATALALLSILTAPSFVGAQAVRDLSQEGVDAFQAGDYAKSQRLLREYVEANADRKDADPARLGEAYHYLGLMTPDAKLAEGYFLAVAQRYPTSPVADESTARLAQLYGAQGRYADARREWNALATNYPLSSYGPAANLRIGQAYFAEGDLQNAYDAFTTGFSKMKTYQRSKSSGADLAEIEGEYVFWLGRTLLAREAYGDARKYFNLVLLDYPNHPLESITLYYLTQADRAEGKTKDADQAWVRFSESVRNTSLEPVAQNPNLIAIAGARESGALTRPPEADARVAERRAAKAGVADEGSADPAGAATQVAAPEPAGSALTGGNGGGARPEPAAIEPPSGGASADRVLRAPEPGRAGGVVEGEPTPPAVTDSGDLPADAGIPVDERADPGEGVFSDTPQTESTTTEPPPARREPSADESARVAQVEMRGQELLGKTPTVSQPATAETARSEPARAETARTETARTETATPEPAAAVRAESTTKQAKTAAGAAGPAGAGEPQAPPARQLEPIPPGVVFLQVGGFTSATSAAQLSTDLRKKKLSPSISSGLRDGKAFYRVRVGPYEVPREREALETQRAALLNAGYVPTVTRQEAGAEGGR